MFEGNSEYFGQPVGNAAKFGNSKASSNGISTMNFVIFYSASKTEWFDRENNYFTLKKGKEIRQI